MFNAKYCMWIIILKINNTKLKLLKTVILLRWPDVELLWYKHLG